MKTKSSNFWLAIALLLCIVSMIGSSLVQTNFGKVTVKDMRWETASGEMMSALLFVPDNATAKTPAPAIVASHGWYNNREMQDMNYVEYARRGYVVVSMDMYGHGDSDILYVANTKTRATGMTDVVELVATLPYVDKAKIAVTGHSNGARAANYAIDDDNAKTKPLIHAILMVANDPTYVDAQGKYTDKYGARDVGVVAAQEDEFFFRVKQADGSMSAPRDYINQATAQSFLNFGADPAKAEKRTSYVMYTSKVGGIDPIRVIYNPVQIHPWNTIDSSVMKSSVEFFQAALGAPVPLPGDNQIFWLKEIFNLLGLVGFGMFLVTFTKVLLGMGYFSSLKTAGAVAIQSAPTGLPKVWLWVSLALGTLFSGWMYLSISFWVGPLRNSFLYFFTQAPVFFVGMWAALVGLFTFGCILVGHFFFGGRTSGFTWKERGLAIGWKNLWKTIVLSLAVVAAAFLIVFTADYLFKSDFRFWVIAIKAFTPDKFSIILRYLPFFLIYFVINSIAINSFSYVFVGKKEWINVAVLALFNALAPLVIVIVQYGYFFIVGKSFTEAVMSPAVSNIYGIWLFPFLVTLPFAAVMSRMLYKVTRNPYLAGLIMALTITIISCTNTLTQVP
jgi:dienelactone hydrolase